MSILNTYFSSIKISYFNFKKEIKKIVKHKRSLNMNTNEMKNEKENSKNDLFKDD